MCSVPSLLTIKETREKENVIKKIIRKRKYIYRSVLYFSKKNPRISGSTHFKPVLFKGELYFLMSRKNTTCCS